MSVGGWVTENLWNPFEYNVRHSMGIDTPVSQAGNTHDGRTSFDPTKDGGGLANPMNMLSAIQSPAVMASLFGGLFGGDESAAAPAGPATPAAFNPAPVTLKPDVEPTGPRYTPHSHDDYEKAYQDYEERYRKWRASGSVGDGPFPPQRKDFGLP